MSSKGNGNGHGTNGPNGHVGNLSDEYHAFGDRRDPILDLLKSEAQIEFNGHVGGRISKAQLAKLSLDSGVGVATLRNWFYGDTKRPRSLSTHFVAQALGITTKRFRRDGSEIKTNW
jgi:hypothetical protein